MQQFYILTLWRLELLYEYGDLQLIPEVVQILHFEVPYPSTKRRTTNIRRASGSCPFQPLHIWVEIIEKSEPSYLVGGFYREWSKDGLLTTDEQLTSIKVLTSQIERADTENKPIIIMGDANICTSKWNNPDFKHKSVAEEIKGTLAQCCLLNVELGHTYLADRLNEHGLSIQSSLDHIFLFWKEKRCRLWRSKERNILASLSGNSLHNTKTTRNVFKIILWRLLHCKLEIGLSCSDCYTLELSQLGIKFKAGALKCCKEGKMTFPPNECGNIPF